MDIEISQKQKMFIDSPAFETLYGGAAGGGKSYAQCIDALLYALQYPKSKQLILRRTFPELDKSIIRTVLEVYPAESYKYNQSSHTCTFFNGALIDFAFCDAEKDVYKYQSAEYDVIRFDELTHFTETMYKYLISRCRGANSFPKMIKSSTNPGHIGHTWVKARFIDSSPPMVLKEYEEGSRIFIPAKVDENQFLMRADPDYVKRLKMLPENQRKALLDGDWNIFEGQYFSMWKPDIHVIKPFVIPSHWVRYFTLDYGRDMLAGYWIAVDEVGKAYVYKEIYRPGLLVTEAIATIKNMTSEHISVYYAPPDLWNKHNDTGKSTAEYFAAAGLCLVRAKNDRVQGWYDLAEWLKPIEDEQGYKTARLQVFENCTELIRCLPSLQYDANNPNDCAKDPHEITHAPDALRYFCAGRPIPTAAPAPPRDPDFLDYDDQVGSFLDFGR